MKLRDLLNAVAKVNDGTSSDWEIFDIYEKEKAPIKAVEADPEKKEIRLIVDS